MPLSSHFITRFFPLNLLFESSFWILTVLAAAVLVSILADCSVVVEFLSHSLHLEKIVSLWTYFCLEVLKKMSINVKRQVWLAFKWFINKTKINEERTKSTQQVIIVYIHIKTVRYIVLYDSKFQQSSVHSLLSHIHKPHLSPFSLRAHNYIDNFCINFSL